MQVKSPFLVLQQFLSPLLCEDIVDRLNFIAPEVDVSTSTTMKSIKRNDFCESIIFERLGSHIKQVEQYYTRFKYKGTEVMDFEWFPTGSTGEVHCENSTFTKHKKWLRTKNRDLSVILFLSEYQPSAPFDDEFEVAGGKLEFPQHGFGFNPERGTLIMFPSSPHFTNATAHVDYGDLFQVRFHLAGLAPYLYDPTEFPGNYANWFEHLGN